MSSWYIEHRSAPSSPELAADVAKHVHLRSSLGPSVVVVTSASRFLSVMRKRWVMLERWVQREISSTLDKRKLLALHDELTRMRTLNFASLKSYDDKNPPDVLMLGPDELAALPPHYTTLYIAASLNEPQREVALAGLDHHGLLVDYDSTTKALTQK